MHECIQSQPCARIQIYAAGGISAFNVALVFGIDKLWLVDESSHLAIYDNIQWTYEALENYQRPHCVDWVHYIYPFKPLSCLYTGPRVVTVPTNVLVHNGCRQLRSVNCNISFAYFDHNGRRGLGTLAVRRYTNLVYRSYKHTRSL